MHKRAALRISKQRTLENECDDKVSRAFTSFSERCFQGTRSLGKQVSYFRISQLGPIIHTCPFSCPESCRSQLVIQGGHKRQGVRFACRPFSLSRHFNFLTKKPQQVVLTSPSAVLCCAWSLSRSHLRLVVTPGTVACQVPWSMGFSRQEYWSELPCPPPGDLPDPGIEPRSPTLQVDSLPAETPGKPLPSSK